MKKSDIVRTLLKNRYRHAPLHSSATAYAPSNIALCKYWGKRDQELNLPVTSSLSISLANKGSFTELSLTQNPNDVVFVNGQQLDLNSSFGKRLQAYFDLFRVKSSLFFETNIKTNIPIGAGLASSACGFASMVMALNALFGWELKENELSILARLGSGSASRSLWHGFVEWRAGEQSDGLDSFGELIADTWPEFCVGLLIITEAEKEISSRVAMQRTVTTSPLYSAWPLKVKNDLSTLKRAIGSKDFRLLGETAESNALTMHATMLSAWPPVFYALPETITLMKKIWALREQGFMLFFTQDAGPNLKLLFLEKDAEAVQREFPHVDIIKPFKQTSKE